MSTIRAAFLMLMGISFIAPNGGQTQLFEPNGSQSPTYRHGGRCIKMPAVDADGNV